MNTEITLGQNQPESLIGTRDALHVPVIICTAHDYLSPGQRVGVIAAGGRAITSDDNPVGVIDPFLDSVHEGMIVADRQRNAGPFLFYLCNSTDRGANRVPRRIFQDADR